MKHDNKNFIIAIALSIAIVLGWQYFYAQPMLEKQQKQAEIAQQAEQNAKTGAGIDVVPQPGQEGQAGQPNAKATAIPSPDGSGPLRPRVEMIAASKRIKIDNGKVIGSINLTGAKLDDLQLVGYRVDVDKSSDNVTLLSPAGAELAYFAEQGWVAAAGTTVKLPDNNTQWQADDGAVLSKDNPVTLTYDNGEGLVFKRTIAIDDKYMFSVTQSVTNNGSEPVTLYPYSRIQRQGLPKLQGIYVIHEGPIGVHDGTLFEESYKDLAKGDGTEPVTSKGGWIGFTDKYWAVTTIPPQDVENTVSYRYIPFAGRDQYQTDFILKTPLVTPTGGSASFKSDVFAGAKVVDIIGKYEDSLKIEKFDLLIDWGWFYFLTKPMFFLLHTIQAFVGNFGIAIMIVTVLVKLVFFPLANMSYRSMSKMKLLQPEMKKIKEKFPDDKVKQQQATMELYKNANVSPLSGCLPVVVQIPVFFSLYKVIYVTIEMRHAPFYAWIHDLSAPDPTSLFNLFGLIPISLPHMLMVGVLPLIMGITMWIQMKLNPAPPDPAQAMIFNLMPIFFTFLLAGFPAGLVLYWAWNNTLSIIQQWTIMKRQGVDIDLLGNIRSSLPKFGRKNNDE